MEYVYYVSILCGLIKNKFSHKKYFIKNAYPQEVTKKKTPCVGHLHHEEVLVPGLDRHGFDVEHSLLLYRQDNVQYFPVSNTTAPCLILLHFV